MKKLIKILLLFILVSLSATTFGQNQTVQNIPSQSSIRGLTVSVSPANPNKSNPNKIYFEIKPGTSHTEKIKLNNPTDQTITIKISAVDSITAKDGLVSYKTIDSEQTEFGLWSKFSTNQIELKANQEAIIDLNISAPSNLEEKEYTGGIEITNYLTNQKPTATGITEVFRIIKSTGFKVTQTPQQPEKLYTKTIPVFEIAYFFISFLAVIITLLIIFKKNIFGKHSKNK
jgi:hypothetical protein